MEYWKLIKRLSKKADSFSCFNCSHLKIQRGFIWCEKNLIESFSLNNKINLRLKIKSIIIENNCPFNDSYQEIF